MQAPSHPLEGVVLPADDAVALLQIQPAKAIEVFTDSQLVEAILGQISEAAKADYTPDTTSDKGRKAIASRAYRVAQTKTYIDEIGKSEVARLKDLPKAIDAGRKTFRDRLDALKDEIRQPLTDWEAERKRREDLIVSIKQLPIFKATASPDEIRDAISRLDAHDVEAEPEDFREELKVQKIETIAALCGLLRKREQEEADAKELERLRQEKTEREQKEREEQLRKEGEERERQRQEDERRKIAEQSQAPASPLVPEEPTSAQPTAPVETPAQTAAAQVINEDLEHRRAVNREALAAMLPHFAGDEEAAKGLLLAIVRKQIPHVSIAY